MRPDCASIRFQFHAVAINLDTLININVSERSKENWDVPSWPSESVCRCARKIFMRRREENIWKKRGKERKKKVIFQIGLKGRGIEKS